jgi:RNA polymerase sigma factor (sigma-70 family)
VATQRDSQHRFGAGFAGEAFAHFRDGLRRYLLRRLRSREEADDVAQEVYLRLLRLPDAHSVQHPQAYVYRVASNVLYEFTLHRSKEIVAFDSEIADHAASELADDRSVDESYDRSGREQRLAAVIDKLPPMQRAVLVLAKQQGLSHAEIADKLGISINTTRVHLYRAMNFCRTELLQGTDDHE